jgi:hypothetical protein
VDICSFGRLGRDSRVQLYLRETLYGLLTEAFEGGGIPWGSCHHEDRGDGVLIVLPRDVSIEELLDRLIRCLARGLHDHNRRAATPSIQLRLAAHSGLVVRDDHGVTGPTLIHLYRLLDAQALRKAIAGSRADLGVIISNRLHEDAVAHGGLADPAAYRRVRVRRKETRTSAWLRIPSEDVRERALRQEAG